MSASSPSSTFSTSASTVASPHSTRCSPQIQRSPGRLTGSAGGSGASSASSTGSSSVASSRSSSASSKPSRSRSKASSFSAASSAASISSFQPALVAIWLSAIISARRWVGVRCDSTITGASDNPSFRAASTRPWPATITPSSPTSTGLTKPNSAIDPAICATCSSEWVRALRACGINRSSGHRSTLSENCKFIARLMRPGPAGGWYRGGTVPGGCTTRVPPRCTRGLYVQKRRSTGVFEDHGAPAGVVTGRGGNSDFQADGSDVPGGCPPHTSIRPGGPALYCAITRCSRLSRSWFATYRSRSLLSRLALSHQKMSHATKLS